MGRIMETAQKRILGLIVRGDDVRIYTRWTDGHAQCWRRGLPQARWNNSDLASAYP